MLELARAPIPRTRRSPFVCGRSISRKRSTRPSFAHESNVHCSAAKIWRSVPTSPLSLVHAESDGLPGLHVDRYGEFLVVQFLAAGVERWRVEIVRALEELAAPLGIYERSDVDVRKKEGLEPRVGVLRGDAPPSLIEIQEGESRFLADVVNGHKTGFYFDQRENRLRIAQWAADETC